MQEPLQAILLPEVTRRAWLQDLAACDFPCEADPAAWNAFDSFSRELAAKHLPADARDALVSLADSRGILVVENLPVDTPLMAPPKDNFRPAGKPAISEAVHLGVVRHLAEVFGFREEEEGALFHQIAPKSGREQSQGNGSVVPFHPHSDDAFLFRQHRPEFLSLYGLLNERSAPTWLFPVEQILEHLDPGTIDLLQRPIFRHAPPQSFNMGSHGERESLLHPVIERHAEGWDVSYNTARTSGVDTAAEEALAVFREGLQQAQHREVIVAPGTLVIFSNLRHLHGRGAISGRRWLQRLYSRRDLSALRADSGVAAPGLIFQASRLVAGYANLV